VRRTLRPAFATFAILILVLAACQGSSSESPSGSAQPSSSATGGTVRIGIGGAPDSLNPGIALLTEAFQLFELVYDTPISIAPDGSFQPELASTWDVSDDGLTYTLHLVDNAVFHDGTPMTSDDVKFSLETYRDNPDFPYQSSYPDVFTSIEAPDATTVVLHSAGDGHGGVDHRRGLSARVDGQIVDRKMLRTGWRPRHGAGSTRPFTARTFGYEPQTPAPPGLVWTVPGRHATSRSTI